MNEHGKHLAQVFALVVVLTLVAGIVVFYVGSSLPSGAV